jgi:hypothetical protein
MVTWAKEIQEKLEQIKAEKAALEGPPGGPPVSSSPSPSSQ